MERVSHYRIVEKLGAGAMGVVYRAMDDRLGRHVAIKLLGGQLAGSEDMEQRLLREAQAASALNHPGIVTVHDIGSWKGQLYIVMELVDGESFSRIVGSVSVRDALRLVAEAADALGLAHARGIIHRDVKSDNLMRTRDGRVKVLDFGLAKALRPGETVRTSEVIDVPVVPPETDVLADTAVPVSAAALAETMASTPSLSGSASKSASDLTHAGAVIGTPAYMAPEQTRGRPADAKSEVFSLGVVLYELLVGKRPFDRATVDETMKAISTEDPRKPSEAAPERRIGGDIDRIVMKALARERSARTPDMAAFAAQLREALARREASVRAARMRPFLVGGGLLAVATVAVAVGVVALRGGGAVGKGAPPAAPSVKIDSNKRITHDVGCEEAPTFDADGDVIVYDGLVDGDYEVMSMDLRTGERKRLTHSPGWDYNAAVSPDGKWVAFVRLDAAGRHLMLTTSDGDKAWPARDLGFFAGSPGWSGDGELICSRAGEIVAIRVAEDGSTSERVITKVPDTLSVRLAATFGDGDVYAIWKGPMESARDVLGVFRDGKPTVLDDHVIATQGGLIASRRLGAVLYPRLTDMQTTELVRLARDGTSTIIPGIEPSGGFDLCDDARRVVYSTCREFMFLVRIRPRERRPVEILPRSDWRDYMPVRLDDRTVLFSSERSGTPQVWTLDLETSAIKPVAIAGSAEGWPSPDGKRVVHAGKGGIAVATIGGNDPEFLTDKPADSHPRFTADGTSVVFERTGGIWIVSADGGGARKLADGTLPAPALGDTRVAYLAGGTEIRILDLARPEAPPATVPGTNAAWTSIRWSRDGTRLLLIKQSTEIFEAWVDGSRPPESRWHGGQDGIGEVDYAPDGDGYIASLGVWDGDLWLVEGEIR